MDVKTLGFEKVDRIHLAEGKVSWTLQRPSGFIKGMEFLD
jgi:hypothetical protein